MSSFYWFVAGFLTCIVVSVACVAFLVWRTPPAADEPAERDDIPVTRLGDFRRRLRGRR